jgi:hypothetical protein
MQTKESDRLLTESQTAEMLGVAGQTLGVWRSSKRYNLRYIKVGRNVRYRLRDVEAFLDSRTVGASTEQQKRAQSKGQML